MADKKVSQLTSTSAPKSPDLFLIVTDPNGTPTSQSINHKALFGHVTSNVGIFSSSTVITANLNINTSSKVVVNNFIMPLRSAPASNSSTSGLNVGQMFVSNNYLYVVVNATTIKRTLLSAF